jgi:hypothetical protein
MMNKEMFNELLESVQEMDEIVKKEKEASRSFEYPGPELKSTRGNRVQITEYSSIRIKSDLTSDC